MSRTTRFSAQSNPLRELPASGTAAATATADTSVQPPDTTSAQRPPPVRTRAKPKRLPITVRTDVLVSPLMLAAAGASGPLSHSNTTGFDRDETVLPALMVETRKNTTGVDLTPLPRAGTRDGNAGPTAAWTVLRGDAIDNIDALTGQPPITDTGTAGVGHAPARIKLKRVPETPEFIADQLTKRCEAFVARSKNWVPDDQKLLTFVKAQQNVLMQPPESQNWKALRQIYLDVQDVSPAEMKKIEGHTFGGGWTGSGTLNGMSNQLSNLLAILPVITLAATSLESIKADPRHYAWLNFGMQLGFSLMSPIINSVITIPMVARQELMRAKGQPARSKEMKAPLYNETTAQLKIVSGQMDHLNKKMDLHVKIFEKMLTDGLRDTEVWNVRKRCMESDGEEIVKLLSKNAKLIEQFAVRRGVIDLNYAGQLYSSYAKTIKVAGTLAAQIVGTVTGKSHYSNYITIGASALAMAAHQFWGAPQGQWQKQNKTLMETIKTTKLLKNESDLIDPQTGAPDPERITIDMIDKSDILNQWKTGPSVAIGQFAEVLSMEMLVRAQKIADILGVDPHEYRELENLCLSTVPLTGEQELRYQNLVFKQSPAPMQDQNYETLIQLREEVTNIRKDKAALENDRWTDMSLENQKLLYHAISGEHEWATTFRTAWARFMLPSELLPQIGQRFGSQFQMIMGGSNTALIVSAIFRLLQAYAPEVDGKQQKVIPDSAKFATFIALAGIGLLGAFASGALVNDKITRRIAARKAADDGITPRVGFQPKLVGRALREIGHSIFALPIAIKDRVQIQSNAKKNEQKGSELKANFYKAQLLTYPMAEPRATAALILLLFGTDPAPFPFPLAENRPRLQE